MEKQTEMSLDDVLSSIKQMVIDDEPPVLELTERVSDDGSIITLEDAAQPAEDSNGMSAFLKMAQSTVIPDSPVKDVAVEMTPISDSSGQDCNDKKDVLRGLILSVAEPIIREWLSNNLESITRSIVEEKVNKGCDNFERVVTLDDEGIQKIVDGVAEELRNMTLVCEYEEIDNAEPVEEEPAEEVVEEALVEETVEEVVEDAPVEEATEENNDQE